MEVIPDKAKMICYVRAPTRTEAEATLKRVLPCFEAAALATGCTVKTTITGRTFDLRQNAVLGGEVANIVTAKFGEIDYEWGIKSASTDFGNVTYALPALHPGFCMSLPFPESLLVANSVSTGPAIPTVKDGGNHTIQFTEAASTPVAHSACLDVTKALAATGVRVLIDDEFIAKVNAKYSVFPDTISDASLQAKKAYDEDVEIQKFLAGN
ncbi:hypothetical protein H0H93_009393 [Arthromyces matolae]|nr:hypothetical protein H0H93_009393 [Arthromyces matolae]